MDIDCAIKLFDTFEAKDQYIKSLKRALCLIDSKNVYDIFSHIDEIYEKMKKSCSHKTLIGYFRHIKCAYDKMSGEEKQNVSTDDYEKVKIYASSGFYKKLEKAEDTLRQQGEQEQEEPEYGEEQQDMSSISDDDSEEEISFEEMQKDKVKLEMLNKDKKTMPMKANVVKIKDEPHGLHAMTTKLDKIQHAYDDLCTTLIDVKRDNENIKQECFKASEALIELKKEIQNHNEKSKKCLMILKVLLKAAIKDDTSREICMMVMESLE
jgi:hypothetical protein